MGFLTRNLEKLFGIVPFSKGKSHCPCYHKMFTYVGISLSNKKFQVGSTTDFDRRYQQHLRSNDNPEFHNALQSSPLDFFWLVSEDDGSINREEEQFYLDFYFGTPWCYNKNPRAEAPPSRKNKTWGEESRKKLKHSLEGLVWVNDGKRAFKVDSSEAHLYSPGRGKTYNNGVREVISLSHPGEGWEEGQLPSHKKCPETRKMYGERNGVSRPIYLWRDEWDVEQKFESISLACQAYGLQKSNLCGVLKGERKQHKGFKARYA